VPGDTGQYDLGVQGVNLRGDLLDLLAVDAQQSLVGSDGVRPQIEKNLFPTAVVSLLFEFKRTLSEGFLQCLAFAAVYRFRRHHNRFIMQFETTHAMPTGRFGAGLGKTELSVGVSLHPVEQEHADAKGCLMLSIRIVGEDFEEALGQDLRSVLVVPF
jgi:hypothetical protein